VELGWFSLEMWFVLSIDLSVCLLCSPTVCLVPSDFEGSN